jgi:hypothetical protein
MKKRALGLSLIVLGLIILFSKPLSSITGFTIASEALGAVKDIWIYVIGLGMMIVGVGLINLSKYEVRARQLYESGGYMQSTRDLIKLARKMGYEIEEGHREGTRVISRGDVLTVIPNHRTINAIGTGRGILEAILTGVSNFRNSSRS